MIFCKKRSGANFSPMQASLEQKLEKVNSSKSCPFFSRLMHTLNGPCHTLNEMDIRANSPEETPVAQILVQFVHTVRCVPVERVFGRRVLNKRRGL